jgi:hypothetical protein
MSNDMDQMELRRRKKRATTEALFSWKSHPPSLRWNAFYGDIHKLVLDIAQMDRKTPSQGGDQIIRLTRFAC